VTYTAIVLAGGTSRRFAEAGASLNKLTLAREGRTLLAGVIDGLHEADATQIIVVGQQQPDLPPGVAWTFEVPTGGGPVAGLAAGLELAACDATVVLAGDAPRGPLAVTALVAALDHVDSAINGIILSDDGGRLQPLCAAYRTAALRVALDLLPDLAGAPMRALIERLNLEPLADEWRAAVDIDTPTDAARDGYS
jgi:molybdopterin-guanine dinucleotide biosynthesis protein A